MQEPETLEDLRGELSRAGNLFELAQVTHFQGYHTRTDGTNVRVTVEVMDHGPEAGEYRWVVMAEDEEGRKTRCNGAPDVSLAIAITQWAQLDVSAP